MGTITDRLPGSDTFTKRRGAVVGLFAGVMVPLLVALVFTVSFRGYGIMDSAPTPPQIYTAF